MVLSTLNRLASPDERYAGNSVLVTGANGVLGVPIVSALLDQGARVVALSRNPDVFRRRLDICGVPNSGSLVVYPLDLRRRFDLLRQLLSATAPEVVFHLAAEAIVSQAEQSRRRAFATNCSATFALCDALRSLPEPPVLIVSISDKAYGPAPTPYREDGPLLGGATGGVYELTKVIQDQIAAYHGKFLPVVRVRCSNLVGLDLNLSRVVPGTFHRALRSKPACLFEGAERMVRTYVDARDAARAFLSAGSLGRIPGIRGESFNVANPANEYNTKEVIERALLAAGQRSDCFEVVNRSAYLPASAEIPEQTIDVSKARRFLEWEPRIRFNDSLGWAWDAHRQFFGAAATPSDAERMDYTDSSKPPQREELGAPTSL